MDRYKVWLVGSIAVMVVIVALGWFLGVAPQLASRDAAEQSREAIADKNVEYEAMLAALRIDDGKRSEYERALHTLAQSVPFGTDYPRFVGELDEAAAKRGVSVTSVVAGDPQGYAPPAGDAAPAPAATPDAATPSTPAPSAPAVPAAGETATAPMPFTSPLVTGGNFMSIPVTITVTGGFDAVMRFVEDMQLGPRLFLVDSVSTVPLTGADPRVPATAGQVTGTIGGYIYALVPGAE